MVDQLSQSDFIADEIKAAVAVAEGDEEERDTWQLEGFESFDKYEAYYTAMAKDMYRQSYNRYAPIKEKWMRTDKRLKQLEQANKIMSSTPSQKPISLVPQAIEKAISLQVDSRPRPQTQPLQQADEQYSSALNFFINLELDSTNFDMVLMRALYDAQKFSLGCIKQTMDPGQRGPLGKGEFKIVPKKIDPRNIWPDPFAKSWEWEDMAFLCITEAMDISEIRRRYPVDGWRVDGETNYSRDSDLDIDQKKMGGISFDTRAAGEKYNFQSRKRALVKEIWLKSDARKFVPDLDANGKAILDIDGEPIGVWEKRYPRGRLLVVCGDVLLMDEHNPFRHGHPPYTFFVDQLTDELFAVGNADTLITIEDKLNLLGRDAMKNLRANMNAPWVVDNTAFDSTEKYNQLSAEEGAIISKNQGTTVERLPPQEIPMSLTTERGWLETKFNDLSGVTDVMQGNVAKGSQLSADAISNLQGASAATIKMKGNFLEHALKEYGYQLTWNIRQANPTQMTITLNNPSNGEQIVIEWDGSDSQADYAVSIISASSLPGNKGGVMQSAINMYDKGLIDREAALDQMQYPGRGAIIKRINDRVTELAKLGVDVDMKGNKNGKAGRKESI